MTIYILLHSISAVSREFLEPVYSFGCPKNRAVLHPEVSFFIRQINSLLSSLLKVGHLTHLLLSQVWYGRRKPWRFHTKKKKTATQIPMRYSYFLSNIQQVTIQQNLGIVYACFRTIDFNLR